MAISRIGTGWPVEDRDYVTIDLWDTAKGGSGESEEGILRGDVVSGTSTEARIDGPFPEGALLRGHVAYTGNNLLDLAFSDLAVTISTANVIVRDLYCKGGPVLNSARVIGNGSDNSFFENCHIKQQAGNSNTTIASSNAKVNSGFRKNIIDFSGQNVGYATGFATSITLDGNIFLNYLTTAIQSTSGGSSTERRIKNNFAVVDTGSSFNVTNFAEFTNNATADATGQVTGYTTAEFVDFANEDYRIKQSSDLFALGIGAFFEESGTDVDSTVAATWPLFQTQASQSSTAPDITSDIAAHWPVFGVSVSQGAQVPDIDSTIAAAWPLFSVQVNQELELPQYQATIAATWPMLSASVSQQSEVPQYSSDLAVTWPLFNVSVEQESQAPAIEITAAVTWPLFSIAANQESQLPEGATSIAVTWPLFGVDASQQSTVPEFDSTIAAAWPLFQVSASQQQELPSGATAVAIEWPMFGVQTSQESTIPEFTATVAAAWPLFSVSILAGEFEFFASPQARVDIPNLSRRVDIPSLSRRIDI